MRLVLLLISLTAFSATFAPTSGQEVAADRVNGSVVAQVPCRFTTFEEQSAFTRRFYSKMEYEGAKNNKSIEYLKIHYISDRLKVVGYIVRPRGGEGRRYPDHHLQPRWL
jgi:hypothetical protein